MLIMTQDRVSGIFSDKNPLGSYGPGNTRDESNRNSWVSSDTVDKLEISCFTQVSGLFLGRYQADSINLTYKGVNIYDSKVNGGFLSVGYTLGSNGSITGTLDEIITGDTTFYYQGGTILKFKVLNSQSSREINVNDFVTASSGNSSLNTLIEGTHRIIAVQTDNVLTKLRSVDGKSNVDYVNTVADYFYIHINDSVADTLLGEQASIYSGISSLLTLGSGLLSEFSDTGFYYDLQLGYQRSSRFVNEDSPFEVGNYVSFSGVTLQLANNTVLEDLSTTSKSYPIIDLDESALTFTIRVYRTSYDFLNPDTNEMVVNLTQNSGTSTAYVNFGTSIFFYGNGYRHGLGIDSSSTTTSNVTELFSNNEVVSFENFTSLNNQSFSYIFNINNIEDSVFIKSYIKDRESFSVRSPFAISASSAFAETDENVIEIRKYVLDTENASTTDGGPGTPIRRIPITTRVFSSLSGFVTGEATKVESNYIPLPREGYESKLIIEFESNINHNKSGLFKQFLLEQIEIASGDDYISVDNQDDIDNGTGLLTGKTYKTAISTFKYNDQNNGLLELTASGSHSIVAGDRVYLKFDTNYYSSNITLQISSFDSGLNQYSMSTSVDNIYEGMKVSANNIDSYVTSINYLNDSLILSKNISVTSGSLVFEHSADFEEQVLDSLNRVHKVFSVNGNTINIYAPNFSTIGDMTVKTDESCAGSFVAKVGRGSGRFIRDISNKISSIRYFLWNSDPDNNVTYTIGADEYLIAPGKALAIFDSSHGLVNNDKILIYDLASSTGGGENLYGYDSSYLVKYYASTTVEFEIEKSREIDISYINVSSDSLKILNIITDSDHGISVGDKVSILGTGSHTGYHKVKSVPTSKSFTVEYDSDFLSTYTANSGSVVTGFHYLSSFSGTPQLSGSSVSPTDPIEYVKTSRSVSVQDAESSYENPISVGNHLFLDGYYLSSGEYNSVVGTGKFSKTPKIIDSITSSDWRSDGTSSQGTFLGPDGSLNCQIEIVKGDGTDYSDVQLLNAFGVLNKPIFFTSLLNAVRVAILRAGVSRELPNPQVGVTNTFKDYSIRNELPTGAYYYLNRDSAKSFTGRIVSDPESVDRLVDFGATQLAKPFPSLIISGNKGNMKKLRTRSALYGYFLSLPAESYSNKLYNLKEASFSIQEVL